MVQPTALENVVASDPRNYQIPARVCLFFLKKGGVVTDWLDLGNVISPAVAPTIDRLDHFSNRRGERVKDKSIISQRQAQLNFILDEINRENLRLLFGSASPVVAGATIIPFSRIFANPGGVGVITLGQTMLEAIGTEVVRNTRQELPGTPFVEGAGMDYVYDPVAGTITIDAAGTLTDATEATGTPEVHIFFQKSVTTEKVTIWGGTEIEGQAKLHVLPVVGHQYQIEFPNVVLRNNGEFTIGTGEEYQQIPLQFDILADANGDLGTQHNVVFASRLA